MEKEEEIYKRGCNINSYIKVKNVDVVIYCMFIGFEVVMGYFYMIENLECFESLILWCI